MIAFISTTVATWRAKSWRLSMDLRTLLVATGLRSVTCWSVSFPTVHKQIEDSRLSTHFNH